MSWLEALFRGKKPTADDQSGGAVETVAFDGDALPSWMTETGLFRAVSQSPLAVRESWAPSTIDDEPDPFAPPLPQRTRTVSQ